jgi:hypothetical protein
MDVKWKPRHSHKFTGKHCECGSTGWAICRYITSAGHTRHAWFCKQCDKRSNIYEPNHPHLLYVKVFDESETTACEKCGRLGAEEHHWMPRHLSPDECDKWPTGFLCQGCHSVWHDTVTPAMGVR